MSRYSTAHTFAPFASLHYHFEYDYSSSTSCGWDDDSSCSQESICRCGVIEDARVIQGSLEAATLCVLENLATTLEVERGEIPPLESSLIQLVLAEADAGNPDHWEVQVTGGYYGEEIDGIVPSDSRLTDRIQGVMGYALARHQSRSALDEELVAGLAGVSGICLELCLLSPDELIPTPGVPGGRGALQDSQLRLLSESPLLVRRSPRGFELVALTLLGSREEERTIEVDPAVVLGMRPDEPVLAVVIG